MAQWGYTMLTEQAPPDQLVRDLQAAERAGFDFSVSSDHYQPWLSSQGHSGYAWSILGAAAQATDSIPLMTYVTCPILRYHPAVVAQKAATMQILSGNRFRLGLGAGESLNEHVVGKGWPTVGTRHEMFSEAIDVIAGIFDADGSYNHHGKHYNVDTAVLWDKPEVRVPIGIAAAGESACRIAGKKGDALVATDPLPEIVRMFEENGGNGKPRIGQIAMAYDTDRDRAVERAHDQMRWFGLGWKVNADLPGPSSFEAATSFITPEQVGEQLPCGDDVDEFVEKIRVFVDAGFDEVALVQIGGDQQKPFFEWAEKELLPALREL